MAETVDLGYSDETNIRVYRKFMFLKSISTNLSLDSKSHWNFTTLIYHEYIIHRYYIVSVVRLYKQVPFKFVKTPFRLIGICVHSYTPLDVMNVVKTS